MFDVNDIVIDSKNRFCKVWHVFDDRDYVILLALGSSEYFLEHKNKLRGITGMEEILEDIS